MNWSMLEALKDIEHLMEKGRTREEACEFVLQSRDEPEPPDDNVDLWMRYRGKDEAVND